MPPLCSTQVCGDTLPKPFNLQVITPLNLTPDIQKIQATEEQVNWCHEEIEMNLECGIVSKRADLNASSQWHGSPGQ